MVQRGQRTSILVLPGGAKRFRPVIYLGTLVPQFQDALPIVALWLCLRCLSSWRNVFMRLH
jgi:hypothetical protein